MNFTGSRNGGVPLWVLVALMLVAFVVGWFVRSPQVETEAVGSPAGTSSMEELSLPADVTPSAAQLPDDVLEPEQSPREFLENHYGDRWAEVRRLLEEGGVDLDKTLDPRLLIPLEKAMSGWNDSVVFSEEDRAKRLEDLLTDHCVGEGDPLERLNEKRIEGVGEFAMDMARQVGAQYDRALRDAAIKMVDAETAARQRIMDEGLFAYGPLNCQIDGVEREDTLPGGKIAQSIMYIEDIWSFSTNMNAGLYPEYGDAADEYWGILRERALAMIAVLES